MKTPICASKEHEVIIKNYLDMHRKLIEDISNKERYNNYIEGYNLVIDLHNNYGNNTNSSNWYDWIMIIPINITVLTNGFLAGIQTKNNRATVRSYKVIVTNLVHEVADKLEKLERVYE
tara:strand:- start:446 stop:802 length:357 start_codon:yes stop_codon:yes gene_type:complete